jgi:predicted acetyltransferase
MGDNADLASPRLELIPAAPEQEPILAQLLELYAHDFSEFHHIDIGEDGKFGYPSLPLYWSELGRYPFLIRVDGNLAGLALVKKVAGAFAPDGAWDMVEFFVVRGCRRQGIGTRAAHQVWRRFPGPWEVRVMHANAPARHFWQGAIALFVQEAIQPRSVEKGGVRWSVFSFASK